MQGCDITETRKNLWIAGNGFKVQLVKELGRSITALGDKDGIDSVISLNIWLMSSARSSSVAATKPFLLLTLRPTLT